MFLKKLIKKIVNVFRALVLKSRGVDLYLPEGPICLGYNEPLFYSQGGQDLIVMAILKRNFSTSGLVRIIDIGANHHVKYNNTMLFEKLFDTEIFSIDAQSAFIEQYKEYRKSRFINCAIGKTREEINFYVPLGTNENHDNNMFATSEINLIPAELKENVNRIEVTKCPLADVVPYGEFDVLFIDVEGFELDVLEGIDFTKFTFKIICIENNREPRLVNSIRIYLSNWGYEWKARIMGLDDVFIRPGNHKPHSN